MSDDKRSAYQTLHTCLKSLSVMISPIAPFYADRLYRDLTGAEESVLLERPVTQADRVASVAAAPQWARFATAVAGYGEMLKGGEALSAGFGWEDIRTLANGAKGPDEFGYRAEFVQLTRLAETAEAQAALNMPGHEE